MPIVNNGSLEKHNLFGLTHRTFAGPEHGLKTLEVWGQVIEPGAGTPVHRHACEEAIVILEGAGVCTIDGQEMPFEANSTLIIPPDAIHQIRNTGTARMVLIAALGMAPVKVRTETDQAMDLPWQAWMGRQSPPPA